jgi:dimethylhistidine N-methyltransferase
MGREHDRDRSLSSVPGLAKPQRETQAERRAPRATIVLEVSENGDEIEIRDQEPALARMREDVVRGLGSDPKCLPSQYLYDERGAKLFEEICELEEYYLTRTEFSILRRHLSAIARRIGPGAVVIEPGSGRGNKARLLLSGLERPAGFVPVDIARTQLVEVATEMNLRSPDLEVLPVCADFTLDFELPPQAVAARRRIGFLPGSTIGNFEPDAAVNLLRNLARACGPQGGVVIGVDLKKDRPVLEAAYDDARGVSKGFALNYLVRLNAELRGDFDLSKFGYQAPYDEERGRIEMSLVSLGDQTVHVDGTSFDLADGELISTECAYKYDLAGFRALAARAGLEVRQVWTDPRQLFSVQYLVAS